MRRWLKSHLPTFHLTEDEFKMTNLNFMAESLLERAEQWNSRAPDPSKILCRFLSVIPPPVSKTEIIRNELSISVSHRRKLKYKGKRKSTNLA